MIVSLTQQLEPEDLSQFAKFGQTYYADPEAFVHDCFIWEDDDPADYQLEILVRLIEEYKVAARGPHGLGKSALASWATLWFSLTREALEIDWKIPATASVWRQLKNFLFPELHKWARRINWGIIGRPPFHQRYELQRLNLRLKYGEAFAIASDEPTSIEGAHATEILYLYDEAKAIPAETFDAAEGAFSNAGADTKAKAFALAISTPGEMGGRFYDIHKRRPGYEDWWTRHVTLEEAIRAGRISRDWAEQRKKQWGEQSPVYINRVLGEFAETGTDTLIPLSWVEAANERWYEREGKLEGQTRYGVDVARLGDNRTVIAPFAGNLVGVLEYLPHQDTMQTTGAIISRVGDDKEADIHVDANGVGAGVLDRLREQGFKAVGINAGAAAKDAYENDLTDDSGELKFLNMRAFLWWMLRDRLDPNGSDPIALPDDDLLTGDLTAPKWKFTSSGRIQVESKDDLKKRIGRSTDSADGVALAVLPPELVKEIEGEMVVEDAPDEMSKLFGL